MCTLARLRHDIAEATVHFGASLCEDPQESTDPIFFPSDVPLELGLREKLHKFTFPSCQLPSSFLQLCCKRFLDGRELKPQ